MSVLKYHSLRRTCRSNLFFRFFCVWSYKARHLNLNTLFILLYRHFTGQNTSVCSYPEQLLMVLLCLTSNADTASISGVIPQKLAALETKITLARDFSKKCISFR